MTMKDIRQTVGYNSINNYQDVLTVQTLLVQQGAKDLRVDGLYGPKTLKAITEFQGKFLRTPDGVVSPGKKTLAYLNNIPQSLPKKSNTLPTQDNSNNSPIPLMPWQKGGDKQKGSAYDATRNAHYPQVITIEMLDVVNPTGKGIMGANAKALPYLNKYANHFKMTNKREIAHFLSQIAAESHLIPQHEAEGVSKWSIRVIKRNFAAKRLVGIKLEDYRETKKLLSHVYQNRMGNGDEASGDGFIFRGGGFLQLTGRGTYEKLQKFHDIEFPNDHQDFVNNPDLISDKNHYQYAVESAFIFWYRVPYHVLKGKGKDKGKNTIITASDIASAENSTVSDVTHAINGGCNAYSKRLAAFKRLAEYLGVTQADESTSKEHLCH